MVSQLALCNIEATLESLGCWTTLTNKEEDALLSGPMMDERWLNGEEHH